MTVQVLIFEQKSVNCTMKDEPRPAGYETRFCSCVYIMLTLCKMDDEHVLFLYYVRLCVLFVLMHVLLMMWCTMNLCIYANACSANDVVYYAMNLCIYANACSANNLC